MVEKNGWHPGCRLRRAIDASGKGVGRVAADAHVSKTTVYRMIETGEGMLHTWNAVARSLGIDLGDLVGGSGGR